LARSRVFKESKPKKKGSKKMKSENKITRRKFLLTTGGAIVVGAAVGSLGSSCGQLPLSTEQAQLNAQGVALDAAGQVVLTDKHVKIPVAASSDVVEEAQDQVDALLHSINGKQLLDGTWYIDRAYLSKNGYVELRMKNADKNEKVYLFRRGSLVNGVSTTQKFELFVMNNGLGNTITDPTLLAAINVVNREVQQAESSSALERKMTTWRRFNRL